MNTQTQQNTYYSDYHFDSASYYIYMTIAFVYVFFMSLLVDRLLDYDRIDKMCSFTGLVGSDYATRLVACNQAKKDYEVKKFTYMIMIGVLSIFGGTVLASTDKKYATGGWGISTGGIMLVIYYTIVNWSLLDKNVQIGVLGTTLIALFYGSTMLF